MKGSRSTMKTLRIGKVDLHWIRERADGHAPGDATKVRFAKGTQWPPAAPLPIADELDDDGEPLPPVDVEVDLDPRK